MFHDTLVSFAERRGIFMKEMKNWKDFVREEDGMGTVVIMIIVVLVGLVIIFKDQITKIVTNLFGKITAQTGKL